MTLKVTGIDWETIINANGRPFVIGIEGLMVSLLKEERYLLDGEEALEIFARVCRTSTLNPTVKIPLADGALVWAKIFKKPLPNSDSREKSYGELEIVENITVDSPS
ncbi:MAG TPA: hypothetical protein VMD74_01450 [Candidatus Methylomirabilis sp.]|nr:hypothetical protein [Candidatus Methylomirabilis sp.]